MDDRAPAGDIGGEVKTVGMWFGPEPRPLAGWLTRREQASSASAVVIAPPTGYAYWCAHRPLRLLAECLAAAGHEVLRLDYDGTGDSAGDQWEPGRVDAWRASVAAAVDAMRDRGAEHLTLVGARLGATVALLDAQRLGADRVVAWLPPAQGRRYSKEIRLLGDRVPVTREPHGRRGTLVLAGSVFTADTVREISGLTVTDVVAPPASAVLVVDEPGEGSVAVVERLRSLHTDVEHLVAPDAEDALVTPPEYATVPTALVERIARWVGPAAGPDRAARHVPSEHPDAALIPWRGGVVREHFTRIGEEGHAAIVSEPADGDASGALLVLLNPGSENHVGPGRAWVEYARDLALAGRRVMRVDFVGWGESPRALSEPGHPYDAACVADAQSIVAALRDEGHDRIVIGGLCASAWIALEAARAGGPDGVIAINPQMYWRQGDPVEIDWDKIRTERAREIRRVQRGSRVHAWNALDAVGMPGRVGRWLDELADGPVHTELLFTEHDDGLIYLRQRCGRRLARLCDAGQLGVHEVAEIDHPMHHSWLRAQMAGAIEAALERIDAGETDRVIPKAGAGDDGARAPRLSARVMIRG